MSSREGRHYDPAVVELQKALTVAKGTNAAPEVIQSIESSLELIRLREKFAEDTSSQESETLKKIRKETISRDWGSLHDQGKTVFRLGPHMMSGHLEGQFLKSLVSIQKAKRILDIGLFTGYSALSMAEALPADGELVSIDINEYLKPLVTELTASSPHHQKIKIIIGKALDVLKDLASNGERFDIVFLDADKTEYSDYLRYALEGGLLNPEGTVIVDNAFFYGTGYIPSSEDNSTQKFARYVSSDPTLHKVLIPMRDGVMLIRRLADVERDLQ